MASQDMQLRKAATDGLDHGALTVTTTAARITATAKPTPFGVRVKAPSSNTNPVYVGNSDVTAGTTDATDGYPLSPGDGEPFYIDDLSKLYFRVASGTEEIAWFAELNPSEK